jgi:hypothetical protein
MFEFLDTFIRGSVEEIDGVKYLRITSWPWHPKEYFAELKMLVPIEGKDGWVEPKFYLKVETREKERGVAETLDKKNPRSS